MSAWKEFITSILSYQFHQETYNCNNLREYFTNRFYLLFTSNLINAIQGNNLLNKFTYYLLLLKS